MSVVKYNRGPRFELDYSVFGMIPFEVTFTKQILTQIVVQETVSHGRISLFVAPCP